MVNVFWFLEMVNTFMEVSTMTKSQERIFFIVAVMLILLVSLTLANSWEMLRWTHNQGQNYDWRKDSWQESSK
jgi:hypothetical protein